VFVLLTLWLSSCFVLALVRFLLSVVLFQLGEPVDRLLTCLVETTPILLGLGPDRGDDEPVAYLPVERPPRALAGLGAQLLFPAPVGLGVLTGPRGVEQKVGGASGNVAEATAGSAAEISAPGMLLQRQQLCYSVGAPGCRLPWRHVVTSGASPAGPVR
jgi:hypothetical protein